MTNIPCVLKRLEQRVAEAIDFVRIELFSRLNVSSHLNKKVAFTRPEQFTTRVVPIRITRLLGFSLLLFGRRSEKRKLRVHQKERAVTLQVEALNRLRPGHGIYIYRHRPDRTGPACARFADRLLE